MEISNDKKKTWKYFKVRIKGIWRGFKISHNKKTWIVEHVSKQEFKNMINLIKQQKKVVSFN